jgi:hypothetical protein
VLTSVVSTQSASASSQVAGKIVLSKGGVLVLDAKNKVVADPEGKRGRSTKAGSEFFVGETIQTKEDGRVKLQFIEGNNEVVLGTATSLLVERAGGASKGTSLNLARGEVRSNVKTKYSGSGSEVFEVKSANAVAGVRGTIFTTVLQKGNLIMGVQKGSVALTALTSNGERGPPVMVQAGFVVTAVAGTVSAPAPIASNSAFAAVSASLGGDGSSAESDTAAASGGEASPEGGSQERQPASETDDKPAKKEETASLGREPAKSSDSNTTAAPAPSATMGASDPRGFAAPPVAGIATDILRNVNRTTNSVNQTGDGAGRNAAGANVVIEIE